VWNTTVVPGSKGNESMRMFQCGDNPSQRSLPIFSVNLIICNVSQASSASRRRRRKDGSPVLADDAWL
jgi:hypothetical protein